MEDYESDTAIPGSIPRCVKEESDMNQNDTNGADRPADPYDSDDARHVDEIPPYNGDRLASFAFDDEGHRYKVTSGERRPSTRLIPERQWREVFMPEREGVGETCPACGRAIEWDAIIVHSTYHLRCYVGADMDQDGS